MAFYIKSGDTSPAIRSILKNGDGTAVDLTDATVVFEMRPAGATAATLSGSATVVTAVSGIVQYAWATGDTATAGFYQASFKVTFSTGKIETFPNDSFIDIEIDEVSSSDIAKVKFLVGDTDPTDILLTTEQVLFALSESGNDIYLAAAICARSLASKYASRVDTRFDEMSSSYSQLQKNYNDIAMRMERQSKKYGSRGLGSPAAGGISISAVDAANAISDRVSPKFKQNQFANPPSDEDAYRYGD